MMYSNIHARRAALSVAIAFAGVSGAAAAANVSDLHWSDIGSARQSNAKIATSGLTDMTHTRHEQALGFDAESRLVMVGRKTDHGLRNVRYAQTFRGMPVFGKGVVVSEDSAGNVRTLFGEKVDGLAAELPASRVKIGADRALNIGRIAGLGARGAYAKVEDASAKLVVYIDDAGRAHRAYAVTYLAARGKGRLPTKPMVLVDADNGRVLKQWEDLKTALVGTGPGGNGAVGQYEWGSGGKYPYMDVTQSGTTCSLDNASVRAVDLKGTSPASGDNSNITAFSYTCPRNTARAVNGAYSQLNDGFQFGNFIAKMYPEYTGYQALSFKLIMRVHHGMGANAYWDSKTMNFGDGDATAEYPQATADIAGHEVSHGFTEQHSNLTYSGQSGGINEAFSDIAGEATEYYWRGTADFLQSADSAKVAGNVLRWMCTPTKDGKSIDNAANYTAGMNVHFSSGVYNKAACLLTKTAGWDMKKTFQVFARANANYWTAGTTFNQGACGVETAATDLGYAKADVTAAFNAVGVSCTGGGGGGTTTVLTKGVPANSLGAAKDGYLYFKLDVPAGATNLTFTTSGGTGDLDMYVKAGAAPTDSVYDCRPYKSGNAETCTFATPVAGTYYVALKAYATFAGASLVGDYTTGGGGGTCGGTVLCNGTAVALPSVALNTWSSIYTIDVPAGKTSVVFNISGGTGDADLYVRLGSAPTTASYNCRPYLSGNNETCTLNAPAAGKYYVGVYAYAAYSGVSLKATISP